MYEHFYLDDYNISCFIFSAKMARHPLQLRRLLRLSNLGDAILFNWISSAQFVSLIFNMTLDSRSMEKRKEREICFRRDLQLSRVKNDAGWVEWCMEPCMKRAWC